MTAIDVPKEPNGIGGWLILVCLTLVATPILYCLLIIGLVDGTLSDLHLLTIRMLSMIAAEIVVNMLFVLFSLYVAYLFFSHKKAFPRLFVLLLGLSFVAQLLDVILSYVFLDMKIEGTDVRDLVRGAVLAAVWSAYMRQSKRVANTFVKD